MCRDTPPGSSSAFTMPCSSFSVPSPGRLGPAFITPSLNLNCSTCRQLLAPIAALTCLWNNNIKPVNFDDAYQSGSSCLIWLHDPEKTQTLYSCLATTLSHEAIHPAKSGVMQQHGPDPCNMYDSPLGWTHLAGAEVLGAAAGTPLPELRWLPANEPLLGTTGRFSASLCLLINDIFCRGHESRVGALRHNCWTGHSYHASPVALSNPPQDLPQGFLTSATSCNISGPRHMVAVEWLP